VNELFNMPFAEYYGVTPKTYLKNYRLNLVRKKILKVKSFGIPISDIANDFDFWHMGQFAADYKQLFGELPSTTLGIR
jgi:AraC family transcriptional regulator, ethanolamine operon transcriptional activator